VLTAVTQTALWCVIFFLASAGASSAYLTVSEIFPSELRGQAISFFFAISQLAGGVAAPSILDALIGKGTDPGPLTIGFYFGAAIMFAGGLIAWFFRVNAERQSLEDIALRCPPPNGALPWLTRSVPLGDVRPRLEYDGGRWTADTWRVWTWHR
jgi:MFS family permease